jgi:tol-pal system protein YbgF
VANALFFCYSRLNLIFLFSFRVVPPMFKLSQKLLFAGLLFSVAYSPAFAQDSDMQELVDRIERMDRDIKALNLKVYRGGGLSTPPSASTAAEAAETAVETAPAQELSGPLGARLSIRMNELESQMRQMTGQLEETAYRISQLTTRLEKLVVDVDYRLTSLEGGTPAERPLDAAASENTAPVQTPNGISGQNLAAPNQPVTQTPAQPGVLGTLSQSDLSSAPSAQTPVTQTPSQEESVDLAALSPKELYDQSRKLLVTGNYAAAEKSFQSFLELHKDDTLSGNARYWLGETYYVQGNFPQAASVFLEGFQKDQRGAKAPDSLLKLGMSLRNMGKTKEACATFSKLRADFPKLPAHLSKTLQRESSAATCG